MRRLLSLALLMSALSLSAPLWGVTAPEWLHAAAAAPLPAHDEKDDAVLLYSEQTLTVLSVDKVRLHVREAYKILRPGEHGGYGAKYVSVSPQRKITMMRGWTIPKSGDDYEVKEKEAVDVALSVENGELVNDVHVRVLRAQAVEPGAVVGFEYEVESNPLALHESWQVQHVIPAREQRFQVILPAGWSYEARWVNWPEIAATGGATNPSWVVGETPALRDEQQAPPYEGVVGRLALSYHPAGNLVKGYRDWHEMGVWYHNLATDRLRSTPEIARKAAELGAKAGDEAAKIRAVAAFMQHDIRYVAIELGIGGMQPHFAGETLTKRYGDCKDKATLMSSLLHELGVDSYYVVVNAERGAVGEKTPAGDASFDHVVLAIRLQTPPPADFQSIYKEPKLGSLLIFDPTSELTPVGLISGSLQGNWGMLVAPEGGELIELPTLPTSGDGVLRSGKFVLAADGSLTGDVSETRFGDRAEDLRSSLRSLERREDMVKPIETLLAHSVSAFTITKGEIFNQHHIELPLRLDYSFVAANYAKRAGELVVVRPRVVGVKSSALLETKEARKLPIEFEGPEKDVDDFVIQLPAGYKVDDLPTPVDVDYGFASYHSKCEFKDGALHYSRTFEVKELSVPTSRVAELKKLYRQIATDERATAVLSLAK